MKKNKTVRAFQKKLLLEGLLCALLLALCVGAGAGLLFTVICHVLLIKTALLPFFLVIAAATVLAFLPAFFIGHFPSMKKTARRMDELGLQNRASTMLENQENNSLMARLQREDAEKKIAALNPRSMKMRISGKLLASFLCLSLVTAGVFALPHDLLFFGKDVHAEGMDEEQQQIIKDLIDKLRDQNEKAPLEEELKEDIDKIIDRLEGELGKTNSALDQAGKVEDAKNELTQRFDKELSKNSIGKALQNYDITRNTGIAVCNGDTTQLKAAFDALEAALGANSSLKDELYKTINRALEESGVKAGDPLYDAFEKLALDLAELEETEENYKNNLHEVFENAYAAIAPLLEKQEVIEEEKEKFEEILDQGKEELLEKEDSKAEEGKQPPSDEEGKDSGESQEGNGDKPGDQPGGDKPGGDKPGDQPGDQPGGDKPGDQPGTGGDGQNGMGAGNGGESEEDKRTEEIYDPFSGSVSYGEVLAAYYAEFLNALKEGTLPTDIKEFVEQYFASLS